MHAVVFLASMLLAIPSAWAQEPSTPAVELYVQGRDLLSAGKPSEALPMLEKSLALLPSPNTELLIAHANRDLGKRAKAMDYYERAQASADAGIAKGETRYTETSAEARKSKDDLAPKVGTVIVNGPPSGRFTVYRSANDPIALTGPGQVRVDPGDVRITYTPETGATQERTVPVVGGQVATVSFEASSTSNPVLPPSPGGGSVVGTLTIAGSVIAGVGLVGVGLFAGFGAVALSKYNDLDACEALPCEEQGYKTQADIDDERASGDQDALNANISIGVGSAFLLAGGIMILVDIVNGPDAPGDSGPPPVRPALVVGPGTLYAGVIGDFQ